MLTIRDVLYLAVIATLGLLWYADRTTLRDRLLRARAALEIEELNSEAAEVRLMEVKK